MIEDKEILTLVNTLVDRGMKPDKISTDNEENIMWLGYDAFITKEEGDITLNISLNLHAHPIMIVELMETLFILDLKYNISQCFQIDDEGALDFL